MAIRAERLSGLLDLPIYESRPALETHLSAVSRDSVLAAPSLFLNGPSGDDILLNRSGLDFVRDCSTPV